MLKLYLKQAWALLRQNPLFSGLYIAGTGLAIAMTMIVAEIYYVKLALRKGGSRLCRIAHCKTGRCILRMPRSFRQCIPVVPSQAPTSNRPTAAVIFVHS